MSDKDTERRLFRAAMEDAVRLRSGKISPAKPKPKARAQFTRADEKAVTRESLDTTPEDLELEAGDELRYVRSGIAENVLRKLRRGAYRVQSEIDLHGLTIAQAKDALSMFLQECQSIGIRCVRVVHGKGKGSGQRGPVLKGKVNIWLRRRNDVIAFVSAPGNDGGTGALYLLLNTPKTGSGSIS